MDLSSEKVVVFKGSIEDESDVHVSRSGLWGAIEVPFVEGCPRKECLSVIPSQSKRVFGGVFCSKRFCLEQDGVDTVYSVMVGDPH